MFFFEGAGSIESWGKARMAEITYTRFYEGETPPSLDGIDLLVVMGGPMSVHQTIQYPWLRMEKEFIRRAVDSGTPVLGICLGAQLIAAALGSIVKKNPVKEIGWFPIHGNRQPDSFEFPETLTVFHWHGETFELPEYARLLASTSECKNQAFQLAGKKVIGLQFHLETTPESLAAIIDNCRGEIKESSTVMSEGAMRTQSTQQAATIHSVMDQILDYLTS